MTSSAWLHWGWRFFGANCWWCTWHLFCYFFLCHTYWLRKCTKKLVCLLLPNYQFLTQGGEFSSQTAVYHVHPRIKSQECTLQGRSYRFFRPFTFISVYCIKLSYIFIKRAMTLPSAGALLSITAVLGFNLDSIQGDPSSLQIPSGGRSRETVACRWLQCGFYPR